MKTSGVFIIAVAALVAAFSAACRSAAQPSKQRPAKEPSYDFGAVQQLESFIAYLQHTKETNILQRFNDYSNAFVASQNCADLGVTLAVLQRLRDGRTNEVYALLEGQLDAHIVGLATSYRELPASLREQGSLKVLALASDYRAKYPARIGEQAVADAFKLLDRK